MIDRILSVEWCLRKKNEDRASMDLPIPAAVRADKYLTECNEECPDAEVSGNTALLLSAVNVSNGTANALSEHALGEVVATMRPPLASDTASFAVAAATRVYLLFVQTRKS